MRLIYILFLVGILMLGCVQQEPKETKQELDKQTNLNKTNPQKEAEQSEKKADDESNVEEPEQLTEKEEEDLLKDDLDKALEDLDKLEEIENLSR
ncbi:MAG TPA: hypothetical protein VI912_00810 [Candidatus Bilamarchaeaceae archaeon]|nr:hypothetical protein [Candidatus Bilamarchaeaceae archaeon]